MKKKSTLSETDYKPMIYIFFNSNNEHVLPDFKTVQGSNKNIIIWGPIHRMYHRAHRPAFPTGPARPTAPGRPSKPELPGLLVIKLIMHLSYVQKYLKLYNCIRKIFKNVPENPLSRV